MSQKKLNNEELETRLKFYKLKAEHLEQQLAEKDKKIESWKENSKMWENWKETYYKYWKETQKQLQQLRHQICEEIREFVDNYPIKKISFDFCNDIEKKLYQIEQGEIK